MKFRMNNDNVQSLKEFVIATAKKKLAYKDFWVFKEISFEVKKGEVVGIIGRNGAGKSTMLKIISGILTPTSGKVVLNGRVVPMLELGSGFDFELTGRENIFLNGSILGYDETFLKEKYDEIVEFSELGEFIETPIRNYSSGMIMRLAFAIATIVQPEILIVDEILAVGDEAFQRKSKRKMLELMGGGTTVLFVSHSIAQIREMCNRVVWLEKGRLKMLGETKMICDEYQKYINPVAESGDKKHKASDAPRNLSDVLFIYGNDENGYYWRVTCQREQLLAGAIPTNEIHYEDLTPEIAKLYRVFIFVQCGNTERIKDFLYLVKEYNKKVLFDFSGCEEREGASASQEELLNDHPELCDGIIVSNRRIMEHFEKRGCKIFYNPPAVEERMVEYAAWSTYDRDILPFRNPEHMSEDELINYNRALAARRKRLEDGKRIGFFCDSFKEKRFTKIQDVIIDIMREKRNVTLVAECDEHEIPEKMKPFSDRIILKKNADPEDKLRLFSETDAVISIPGDEQGKEDTELQKWIALSLVKVPCIIYTECPENDSFISEKHAFICKNKSELEMCLRRNVIDGDGCPEAGSQAYRAVRGKYCTLYTGDRFAQYIRSIMNHNIVFLVKERHVGGVNWVACHHAALMKNKGYDVTLIVQGKNQENIQYDGVILPVVSRDMVYSYQYMEQVVSLSWESTRWMQNYTNVGKRFYLVQGYETEYSKDGNMAKLQANQMFTPHTDIRYLTTTLWSKQWLYEKFHRDSVLISNGIHGGRREDVKKSGQKIRILISGDGNNEADNLNEAFRITDLLDRDRYEVYFYAYGRAPHEEYEFDRLCQDITQSEVWNLYQECDILLQTNRAECFQTASLEMMAAGGVAVVMKDESNADYLKDNWNCVLYEPEKYADAAAAIKKIAKDTGYRELLIRNGLNTAQKYMWENFDDEIIRIYTAE